MQHFEGQGVLSPLLICKKVEIWLLYANQGCVVQLNLEKVLNPTHVKLCEDSFSNCMTCFVI